MSTQPVLRITIDGKSVDVDPRGLTGSQVRAFRAEVGVPPRDVLTDLDSMDLDYVAAFAWVERRKSEPALTFDEVLDAITYDNVKVEALGASDRGDDHPEA